MRRHEPRTLGAERAVPKAIATTSAPSTWSEEVEHALFEAEELVNKYEAIAGRPFGDGLGFAGITDLRVEDLKVRLELLTGHEVCGSPRRHNELHHTSPRQLRRVHTDGR